MINEATVRAFLTLARIGSFTEAGRELYLSQQAVSKQVAKLEQDLDCVLVNRDHGKVTLTEAGEIYFKAFCQMESIFASANQEARHQNEAWDNTLRIGLPELLNLQPLIRGLTRAYQADNPEVRVIYKSAPHWVVREWMDKGEVDAAFSFADELETVEDMRWLPVAVAREMLVVSAEHPKARPEAGYLDFQTEPVFYTPNPLEGEAEMTAKLTSMGFAVDRLTPTENFLSTCASVEQGQGVAFWLEYCRMLESDAFRTYPTNLTATVVLAIRRNNRKRSVRRFGEEAARQFPQAKWRETKAK